MKKDIAIQVKNISKKFRVPHRKADSLRNVFVNLFAPNIYEEFDALKDISFEVKKGEFLGIIGRNGAGKSTLLKTLAGIYRSDSGSIKISGRISPFLELGIGFNPELSGRDNVHLNATVLGLSRDEIDEKFDEIVAFAELEEFIDQQLKNYSSGMKARLAFSVSIHADREILLMDEVLAVGDERFKRKCLNIFRGYKAQNKTVVLVTHSMEIVREYCDRALLFNEGQIIEAGNVDEVCDEYILRNLHLEKANDIGDAKMIQKSQREQAKKASEEKKKQFITSIVPYDKDGNILRTVTRGEDFYVDVTVQIEEVLDDMFVAVQVFEESRDLFVSGNNMYSDEYEYKWKKGQNIIRLTFDNNNLNLGTIYFRSNLFQGSGAEKIVLDCFSMRGSGMSVRVNNKKSGAGIMYMNHKWTNVIENEQ